MSAGGPQHIGLTWRIVPGREEEYDARHARMWPELEARLRELGVRAFSIFRRGAIVFGHVEVDDYQALTEDYGRDPLAQEWEREFAELIELDEPDPETGWPERLRHVWSLSSGE
jgi:L-rhamnose mutarotase